MKIVLIWVIFTAMIIAGLAWFKVISLPLWLSFERKAFVQSHQYVEARRTAIMRFSSQCQTLPEGAQKQALRQKIIAEKSLLPENVIIFTGDR